MNKFNKDWYFTKRKLFRYNWDLVEMLNALGWTLTLLCWVIFAWAEKITGL